MEEIKQKLTELVDKLETKELEMVKLSKLADEKIKALKSKEEELAARESNLQFKSDELLNREQAVQQEIKVDRDRKLRLDALEQQLNQDKERIQKYLNI